MLVDSHAHLNDPQYDKDREQVIAHAVNTGLHYILNVATDYVSLQKTIQLADSHDFIYIAAGVHPHYSEKEEFSKIKHLLNHPKLVAIGEIGLDFYRDFGPREKQEEVFRQFLGLARERGLPVVIHQRSAQDDLVRILNEELLKTNAKVRGVMHCFSGDILWAKKCIEMGFLISFAGNITYPKANVLREVAKEIPVENMLIETDCPWLAPQNFRGQRCEPAYVKYVAEELARIKSLSYEDVIRITGLNFRTLFNIGKKNEESKIAYKIRNSLYLNITNRCTSECVFCVKNYKDYVKGHYLRLDNEPGAQEIIAAIGDPAKYKEVVFCGYGEPMLRLDILKEVSRWIKDRGGRVRIDTNGHGNLIHNRRIAKELKGLIDSISVSLNCESAEKYEKLCRPVYGKKTFDEVKRFIIECKDYIPEVAVTIIDMPGVDVEKCRHIAEEELGVDLRIRKYDEVG